MFTELGPEVVKKQQQGSTAVEAKEKGGFSYVELNEKKSPRGERRFCKRGFKKTLLKWGSTRTAHTPLGYINWIQKLYFVDKLLYININSTVAEVYFTDSG